MPQIVVVFTEIIEVVPGIQATVMTVGENRLDGIVADGFDAHDIHVALAELENLLTDSMAPDFCRR